MPFAWVFFNLVNIFNNGIATEIWNILLVKCSHSLENVLFFVQGLIQSKVEKSHMFWLRIKMY